MAFGISTVLLPTINSHTQAIQYFYTRKVHRGSDGVTRPLREDNKYRERFWIEIGTVGEVKIGYHLSACVIFYPDGRIFASLCNYESLSTRAFISKVLGTSVRTVPNGQVGILLHVPRTEYGPNRVYVRLPDEGVFLVRTAYGLAPLVKDINTLRFQENRLDRSESAKARKAIKPFLLWAKALEAITGNWVWGYKSEVITRARYSEARLEELVCKVGIVELVSEVGIEHDQMVNRWEFALCLGESAERFTRKCVASAVHAVTLPLGETPKRNVWNRSESLRSVTYGKVAWNRIT